MNDKNHVLLFFNDTATPEIYTLSLHDALPICGMSEYPAWMQRHADELARAAEIGLDRKSTRLNSSHVKISYAVFCLKKKKGETEWTSQDTLDLAYALFIAVETSGRPLATINDL